jgi:hypothetical protein
VDDDAVGQPGVGQQLPGGVSVGDGHGPMLPVPARRCTGTALQLLSSPRVGQVLTESPMLRGRTAFAADRAD